MRSTILVLLASLTSLAVLAGPDAYDPVVLNESAMEAIREGDLATARILLERAARIAPYDARIVRNLRALEAHRAGVLLPDETAPPATRLAPRPRVPPEPPALWPPKS